MLDDVNKIKWPGWETVRLIGRGSFGAVYEIKRSILGGEEEFAAMKIISIPQKDSDIEELRSEGCDDASIKTIFLAPRAIPLKQIENLFLLKIGNTTPNVPFGNLALISAATSSTVA